ncbi:MAG: 5-(carboxyamino)imidazole ribonucleotide mutase [Calditrichaeota bacterium]|nr:5-(carboxyamino)imidazole ribonucleotide mutase [Calditrichota bacterium]MCB9391164.1 5-(carboxyamino)imidazole ribonucleotide mutase [Calditrichota bacterium]
MAATEILILLGSDSDREQFEDTAKYADYFGVTWSLEVISAHRNPEKLRERLSRAEAEGTEVLIACAGMAAHLAGACAAHSVLPVIGVPGAGSTLGGLDALLSTVQMPAGVPVATVAIGKAGARNAVILAAQMLSLKRPELRAKLRSFKQAGSKI